MFGRVQLRVIICHWFRVLHTSLDGLQSSGVEHPLFSAVRARASVKRTLLQDMDAQQKTVVHDLKALQHLRTDTTQVKCNHGLHCRKREI